jgi:polyisoprenoid-binding protein YceI
MRTFPRSTAKRAGQIIAALALAAVPLGALVHAQMPAPANPSPADAQGGDYTVEPNHTRVGFSVSHIGLTDWYGDFTHVAGTLHLDPRDAAASAVDVTIPVATISTTNAKLDGELLGPDWLSAEHYPTIHFVSTKVVRTGPRTARIEGTLTLHGVTQPVTLEASFNAGGVNPMSKTYTVVTTYVPLIGDDVTVRISAAFERKS